MLDDLCDSCREHFEALKRFLDAADKMGALERLNTAMVSNPARHP